MLDMAMCQVAIVTLVPLLARRRSRHTGCFSCSSTLGGQDILLFQSEHAHDDVSALGVHAGAARGLHSCTACAGCCCCEHRLPGLSRWSARRAAFAAAQVRARAIVPHMTRVLPGVDSQVASSDWAACCKCHADPGEGSEEGIGVAAGHALMCCHASALADVVAGVARGCRRPMAPAVLW